VIVVAFTTATLVTVVAPTVTSVAPVCLVSEIVTAWGGRRPLGRVEREPRRVHHRGVGASPPTASAGASSDE
jgi:hypothetical protein